MKICLDIGHGMHNRSHGVFDPGAVGNGTTEYVEAKAIVNGVRPLLEEHGHEVMVIDGGRLSQRTKRAADWGARLLVSFHLNAHDNPAANGTETWLHTGASATSVRLAQAIQPRMVAALGTRDRGIKRGMPGRPDSNFTILSGPSPAVLLEPCFITNGPDMAVLIANRPKLISGIADGILEVAGRREPEERDMRQGYWIIHLEPSPAGKTWAQRLARALSLKSVVMAGRHGEGRAIIAEHADEDKMHRLLERLRSRKDRGVVFADHRTVVVLPGDIRDSTIRMLNPERDEHL